MIVKFKKWSLAVKAKDSDLKYLPIFGTNYITHIHLEAAV